MSGEARARGPGSGGPDELAGGPPPPRGRRSVAALVALLLAAGVVALRPWQQHPPAPAGPTARASPSASVTAWPPGSVTLLPPLCGTTDAQPACPTSTPAGVYEAQLTGLYVEHPFTFRLPPSWTVTQLEYGNGLELRAGADGPGFSLLLSPRPASAESNRAALAYDAFGLASSVASDPAVLSTPPQRTVVDGSTAWQVDARLRPGRTGSADCHVRPACSPLFLEYVSLIGRGRDVAAGALPGRTVRLVFVELPRQQAALFWIWDTATLDTVVPVIDSIHFCTPDQGCPTVSNPLGLQPGATPR